MQALQVFNQPADSTRLMLSTGKSPNAHRITMEELQDRPYPVSMGRFHFPIKYSDIISSFEQGLDEAGMEHPESEFILARKGQLLIGAFSINGINKINLPGQLDSKTLLCFMASENQLSAMKAQVGSKIFVCDNLQLSGGSVLIAKKFTSRAQILGRIWAGITKWIGAKEQYERKLLELNEVPLSTPQAAQEILRVAAGDKHQGTRNIVPFKYAAAAWDEWRHPQGPDTEPRTQWGLLNAWTRALKQAPIQSKMASTTALAAHYGV